MIKFQIGGRNVDPNNIGDALTKAMIKHVKSQIQEKVGSIRDPETGTFPTVVVRGDSFDNMTLHVEGSPEVIHTVKERLGLAEEVGSENMRVAEGVPVVFLSYTSDNKEFAERLAKALIANGIDVWWDKWCIYTGDSLRQKIDEGISGCTHFLVLLTPESITKPWVNQEMDAGLIRKLSDKCKFLPVRYGLPASELPPLLSGMHSPEITSDQDIEQLINDIHGVSRKPPLGPTPDVVHNREKASGYSPAAMALAKLFVERSKTGRFADPQLPIGQVSEITGLTETDILDGLYELSAFFRASQEKTVTMRRAIMADNELFANFDQYWMAWSPKADAEKLAADMHNDPQFSHDPKEIAKLYGWEPRRLNPAITYLVERGIVGDMKVLNGDFVTARIRPTDHLRRFVKSRSQ